VNCPNCSNDTSLVVRSNPSAQTVRRKRQCARCGWRWGTIEAPETEYANVSAIVAAAGELVKLVSQHREVEWSSETAASDE
jgi:transcriptional regulator NrdR family protein